jgi:hypothetical protein
MSTDKTIKSKVGDGVVEMEKPTRKKREEAVSEIELPVKGEDVIEVSAETPKRKIIDKSLILETSVVDGYYRVRAVNGCTYKLSPSEYELLCFE